MTHMTRQPIANTTQLAEGDTVVRKSTDERYRVLAVTPGHAILQHPTSNVERVRSREMLVRSYEVERPEVLPSGLERIGDGEYRFIDWAGDSARVRIVREEGRRVLSVSDNHSSVHFDLDTLRHLAADLEAASLRPVRPTLR